MSYAPMKTVSLTLSQSDIFYDQLLHREVPLYNIGARVHIDGEIDVKVFSLAFRTFVQQHDVLRFILQGDSTNPHFVFSDSEFEALEYIDYSIHEDALAKADAFIFEHFKRPFDLVSGNPLFTLTLIKVSHRKFILYSKYHHIITDGWGTSLLFQRLVKNYNELESLGEIKSTYPFQYADFWKSDIAYYNSESFQADRAYWNEKFRVLPEPLFGKIEKTVIEQQSDRHVTYIPRSLFNAVAAMANDLNVSTFHIILGVLYVYLGRCNNNNSFAVGLPVLNRGTASLKKTVGLFMGITPFLMDFSFEIPFSELVSAIKIGLRNDYRHQRFPIGKIVQDLAIHQDREKLFNVSLSYEKHDYAYHFNRTHATVDPLTHGAERLALAIYVREFDDSEDVKVDFDYHKKYFCKRTIAQLASHFNHLLSTVINSPGMKVCELNLLPPSDMEFQLSVFNNTALEYNKEYCIHDCVDAKVYSNPEKVAVYDDRKSYSYSALKLITDRIAFALEKRLRLDKSPVAILMDRSADLVLMLLGIMKSGRAYIPLDPLFPPERLKYILENSGAKVLIRGDDSLFEIAINIQCISATELLVEDCFTSIKRSFGSDATAYIIYTSGSTGNPKGVEISHNSVVNFMQSMMNSPGMTHQDVLFSVTTYSFDISVLEFFLPIMCGGTVYVATSNILSEPRRIVQKLREISPTVIQATPSFFQMLFDAGWTGSSNLEVLCGGDVLGAQLGMRLLKSTSQLWNMYGPTETTIWSSTKRIMTASDVSNIGKPIGNTDIFILDQSFNLVPIGVAGEIFIGGDGLAKSYFKRPDLTNERFIANPFNGTKKIYRTGDVGKWTFDGEIEFLGRADNQVKVRGYRIELAEVEQNLMMQTDVKEAVVVARKGTSQDAFLMAFVKTRCKELNTDKLLTSLKSILPYYMLPSVVFSVEDFPLTPNKKIDRKALSQWDISGYFKSTRELKNPKNEIEANLYEMWCRVLELERFDFSCSFFELGGHSLKAVQLAELINKNFQTEIKIRDVFTNPTISALSVVIANSGKAIPTQIEKVKEQEFYDVTPSQLVMWLACQQQDLLIAYNMFCAYEVQGQFEKARFETAIQLVIDTHEILRTNFVESNGVAKQLICERGSRNFAIVDKYVSSEAEARTLISETISEPFKLGYDLLVKAAIIRTPAKLYFVFVTHHLIADGLSLQHLINNLIQAYNGRMASSGPRIRFRDYTCWLLNRLKKKSIQDRSRQFWLEQLKGFAKHDLLKRDVTGEKKAVQQIRVGLPFSFFEYVKNISSEIEISPFSILLSTANLALHQSSGMADFCVGVPFSGRSHPDMKDMIGMFVNTPAFRYQARTDESLRSLFSRAGNQITLLADYQEYPYDWVAEELGILGSPFDVLVTLHDSTYEKLDGFQNLQMNAVKINAPFSRLPLVLSFLQMDHAYSLEASFDSSRHSEEFVTAFLDRYLRLIYDLSTTNLDTPSNEFIFDKAIFEQRSLEVKVELNF